MRAGGDDAGADVLGELHGEVRNAAGAALDQDGLAGLELDGVLDRHERGEAGEREGRGVGVGDVVGFLRDDRGVDRDLLGVGAFLAHGAHAEHVIADLEVANAFAERAHDAREVAPQHVGKLADPVRLAGAHLPVGAVDARRVDVDDDLSGLGDGIGQLSVCENVGAAMLFDVHSFHCSFLYT